MSAVNRALLDENVSTAPSTGNSGDVFYIEMPGVAVQSIETDISDISDNVAENVYLTGFDDRRGATSIVGINQNDASAPSSIAGSGDTLEISGCALKYTTYVNGQSSVTCSPNYTDENFAVISTGTGLKTGFVVAVGISDTVGYFSYISSTVDSLLMQLMGVKKTNIGKGCMIKTLLFDACGAGSAQEGTDYAVGLISASTSKKYPAVFGNDGSHAHYYRDSYVRIGYIEGRGAGAYGAINFSGACTAIVRGAFGSVGNSAWGIRVSDSSGARIEVDTTTTTISGALGDVLIGQPGTVYAYASLQAVRDFRDNRGNVLLFHATGDSAWSFSQKTTGGTIGNYPVLAADPATPVDGDCWLKNTGGVRTFNARIGGVTYATVLA